MNKLSLSVILTSAIAINSNGGMVIDIEAGAGIWNPSMDGEMRYGTEALNRNFNFSSLGVDDASNSISNNYLFIDIDHLVPIVPNLRVERLSYSIEGSAVTTDTLPKQFGDLGFNTNDKSKTDIDMTQLDVIAYWGVPFINTVTAGVIDIDFGLVGKNLQGEYKLTNETTDKTETKSFDQWLPLGYLAVQIDLPVLPISLEVSTKIISYKDSEISDNMIKASVSLPIPIPLIDTKLEVGYREQTLKVSPELIDMFEADITTSGIFFGISAKF